MTTISIVIPYLNREQWLPRTLASVAAQTLRPLQVILVDNGSTDGSSAVCRRFAEEQRQGGGLNVELVSESKPGAAAARNCGLEKVTADWVVFFDSDDEMSPDFLECAARTAEEGACDVVAAATRMVFPNGKEKVRNVFRCCRVSDQILCGMLATQGMVFRTDFLRRIEGWDEALPVWNDWELGIRLLLSGGRVRWMRHAAFHRIHQHPESLTGKNFAGKDEAMLLAYRAARADVNELCHEHYGPTRTALDCRAAIISGHLLREGEKEKSRSWMKKCHGASFLRRLFLRAVRRYVGLGLPGAWRICRLTLW